MDALGLFTASFISATLMPGGSEVWLGFLVNEQPARALEFWAIATAGNTLGGWLTFFMGWVIAKRWPARSPKRAAQASIARVRRYGVWVLLFSWVPIIGDPLCFAAGWLRCPWPLSLLLILLGKSLRYALISFGLTAML